MSNSHQSNTHTSSYSQPSSLRSSDSTGATTQSTLFNPPPLPTPTPSNLGNPLAPQESVLNKRGDKEGSLFQICTTLCQRLRGLQGFDNMLREEEVEAGGDADPVTLVWRLFRRGYPLIDLYNATGPRVLLEENMTKTEANRRKDTTYKFIQACVNDLKIKECFQIRDLYGDDTTGFVKVTRVLNQVLDILVSKGVLDPSFGQNEAGDVSGVKKTKRQHIVAELVATERTYVQHLELLHDFKKLVEEKGVISGDAIHDIFFNLNALLDFQRRFLIRVEQTNIVPEEQQNWGSLFVLYKDAFKVYEQYIANQNKCEKVALREFDKLRDIGGPPELHQFTSDSTVLAAFLLKPFQRLSKYPLLLRELRDKGDLDPIRQKDIEAGIEAANSVLQATNAAIDRQERTQAMQELNERVEDWKGHQLQSFRDLLLHGTYQVIKGDSSNPKEQEREYKMYLFEMILLCCKEMNSSKQKNKVLGKQLVDKRGRPRLQLKGRIFMQNVTDTITSAKSGSYSLQIFWKGDPGVESFTIKFTQEDTMRRWSDQINSQRKMWRESTRMSQRPPDIRDNDFLYMQNQRLENPYQQQQEDDDEDDMDGSTLNNYPAYADNQYPISRNDSNTSLRSRSTTGDSINRIAPRQFPMGNQAPALQVRTNGPISPDVGDSFFSPATESPMSTRSSGTPSMYGFRSQPQQHPPIPGWSVDDHRFTAPAMPRQQMNSYQSANRVPQQRPSLPPSAHSSNPMVNRMRSASSPDIANPAHRYDPSQVPPMPNLPSFTSQYPYAQSLLNRSQSSSPAQAMTTLPMRAATQAPPAQQHHQSSHPRSMTPQGLSTEYLPHQNARPFPTSMDHYAQPDVRIPTMSPPPTHATPASLTPGIPQGHASNHTIPNMLAQGQAPTQLKVRVHCGSPKNSMAGDIPVSSMVLVVPTTISFQSLKDRIDAKLQRSSSLSLSNGQVKLKYKDDGDYVGILSDEDVQMAFETWRESQRGNTPLGMGEIELYIQ
ncbi:hypothetical protein BT63DRAFT_431073 [Microthyrium microscopicum]|uniref:DH domain-containing protein n=1 Tax=Microthyrium microscopicum TaxID=703497 RepID=A0A6A6UVU9_9PEZI|nr:hypothetical protein BT63DRAFT_431073 [Microthyrium microscopicum]